MAAEIKYNGSVISSPGAGQTATLKCAGMKMDSDVVVEVAEQSGEAEDLDAALAEQEELINTLQDTLVGKASGMAINGIIEKYKVNYGCTVHAGDFVENTNVIDDTDFGYSLEDSMAVCKLNDKLGVIAASGLNGDIGWGSARVMSLESPELGHSYRFSDTHAGYTVLTKLTENKVLATFRDVPHGCVSAVVLTIDGTTIAGATITEGQRIPIYNSPSYNISAVALSETKVVVAHRVDGGGAAVVLSVDGTNITVGSYVTYCSDTSSFDYNAQNELLRLSDSKVLVVYRHNDGIIASSVLDIDGSNITVGTRTIISNEPDTGVFSTVALTETKVFVTYTRVTTTISTYWGVVLTIDGSSVACGVTKTLHSTNGGGRKPSAMLSLSDTDVFLASLAYDKEKSMYKPQINIVTINGTDIIVGDHVVVLPRPLLFTTAKFLPISVSKNKVRLIFDEESSFMEFLIDDGSVVPIEITVVQPATSRDSTIGVAATTNSSLHWVDVYVVG